MSPKMLLLFDKMTTETALDILFGNFFVGVVFHEKKDSD